MAWEGIGSVLAGSLLWLAAGGHVTSGLKPASLHSDAVPCQACHVEPPESSPARCTPCHERIAPHSRWRGSVHQRAGLACDTCHRIHGSAAEPRRPALLRGANEAETCYGCHPAVRHAQTQRSTHLFRDEGKRPALACSACHDVHGSSGGGEALLNAASLNEVCYRCHDDLRGPFLWEHPPARENCGTCHAAHGSNNPRLLTMRQPMLCQSCHAGDAHISAPAGSRSIWEVNRSCVNCHGRIHGSNHPSGITLQR